MNPPQPRLGRHPLDPPKLHDGAALLARMVADGRLPSDDAYDTIRFWVNDNRTGVDKSGLQARLCHTFIDAAADRERMRGRAEAAVIATGRRMIEDGTDPVRILAAAAKAAERVGAGLLDEESVRALLRAEWDRAHTRFRRR